MLLNAENVTTFFPTLKVLKNIKTTFNIVIVNTYQWSCVSSICLSIFLGRSSSIIMQQFYFHFSSAFKLIFRVRVKWWWWLWRWNLKKSLFLYMCGPLYVNFRFRMSFSFKRQWTKKLVTFLALFLCARS